MLAVILCGADVWTREWGRWASIGAFVVGFRYLLNAGVATPSPISSSLGGILSSVNGTRGSSVMIERVRKSSGRIVGAARLLSAVAADLSARSDAVRFDLNADFLGFGVGGEDSSSLFCVSEVPKTRKSNSSISIVSDSESGWSVTISSGGELAGSRTRSCFLFGVTRRCWRARKEGVSGKFPGDGLASPEELSMREGVPMSSLDIVVEVIYEGLAESESTSASSRSSGGLRRRSRGLRSMEELYKHSFSEL